MRFSFNKGFSIINNKIPTRAMGNGMLFNGILCVLFGLSILAAPELLAYIVATFLIFVGVSLLTMWWRMRNWLK